MCNINLKSKSFSVFFDNIINVKNSVEQIYDNYQDIFEIYNWDQLNKCWFNRLNDVKLGGRTKPIFFVFKVPNFPDLTFFLSNYNDGLINLTSKIAKKLESKLIDVSFCEDTGHQKFMYRVIEKDKERYISLQKDKFWEYVQLGEPLKYEYQSSQLLKNNRCRLSNEIILAYLLEEGIDLNTLTFDNIDTGWLYNRILW